MSYFHNLLARNAFNPAVRQRTWKKLAAQIRHGLSLDQSLRHMQKRAHANKSPLAIVFEHILKNIGIGHNLGSSLTGYATPEEIMLISSGQNSGRLGDGLLLATAILGARKKIRRAVVGALAYPLLLLLVCMVLLLVVSFLVVPPLTEISDPTTWTGAAGTLYGLSSFVSSPAGVFLLILCTALILAVLGTLPLFTGKWRRLLDRVPPWSIYRLTVGAVWLFTLSTLMRSGMQLAHILNEMLNSENTTPYLRERLLAITEESGLGKNLGEALFDTGLRFPDAELVDDLRVYAELPAFHERLQELAKDWMTDGVEQIQNQARIINVSAIVLIITLVGGIALAVGSLQQQLSTGMGG